jgi:2-haloacid dehalogenase
VLDTMTYSTVLFDFDLTLFDTDGAEAPAFDSTVAQLGIERVAAHYDAYRDINQALWDAVHAGELTPGEVHVSRFEQWVAHVGSEADPQRLADVFLVAMGAHGELYPGALDVLERLNDRASLAMITNALAAVQRPRIDRLGIEDLFDAITISTEAGSAKPDAGIFDVTFEALGWPDKSGAVIVGDNLGADIAGGHRYGIDTCWYNPAGLPNHTEVAPTHEIRALDELIDVVGGVPQP